MPDSPTVDELDPLMPIGMFSRASLVSVKALRSYHELGLLVPDSIDPQTGYRSYRVSQLTDAAIIKRLRDLDVALADIGEVVRARDPEVTRKVIANHEAVMRARLEDVTRIVDELHQSLDVPSLQTPVHARFEPARHALVVAGTVDEGDYATFLGDAYGRLYAALQSSGAVMAGPSAARYPAAVGTDSEPIEAFLPITAPVTVTPDAVANGVTLGMIPPALCAVMTHIGSYETVGETYRQLGAWVARNEQTADQPIREYYVVSLDPSTGELVADDLLRTEIAWPIRPPQQANTNERGSS